MTHLISRRTFVLASAALAVSNTPIFAFAREQLIPADKLKPGQWEWYPERALAGPVVVVVTLSDQLAYVYRNGIRVGVSTVSSGKKGYETPTGVFTVLRKERMHHSHKYHNAAMPDSQFFYGGAALHAGGLPGYPSSHGCVHLPRAFADRLFAITHNGTPVIVTNQHSGMGSLSHAGLLLSNNDAKQIEKLTGNVRTKTLPVDKKGYSKSAFSVVVSGADKHLYAFENGALKFDSPIKISGGRSLGEHVFVLKGHGKKSSHLDWIAVGLGNPSTHNVNQHAELAATQRLLIPNSIRSQISRNLHPGSTFVITELSAHPSTRTAEDFVVMRVGKGA